MLESTRKSSQNTHAYREIAASCHSTSLLRKSFRGLLQLYKKGRKRAILFRTIVLIQYHILTKKAFCALRSHTSLKRRARKFSLNLQAVLRRREMRACFIKWGETKKEPQLKCLLSERNFLDYSFDPKKGAALALGAEQYLLPGGQTFETPATDDRDIYLKGQSPEKTHAGELKKTEILQWFEEDFKKKESLEPRKGRSPHKQTKLPEEGCESTLAAKFEPGQDSAKEKLFDQLQKKTALLESKMARLAALKKKIASVEGGDPEAEGAKPEFDECRVEVQNLLIEIKSIKEKALLV